MTPEKKSRIGVLHPKAAGGPLGNSLTIVGVWIAFKFGLDVPENVALAFAAIAGFLVSYAVPSPPSSPDA